MRLGRRIFVVMTGRHGSRRPILVQFLQLLSSLPLTAGMMDRQRRNGALRVSVPKHLNSWNMGTRTTSLIFMTNRQDGPSWLRRSVMLSGIPHLVRLPHLSSAASLRCHLRTVTSMMDRHKLRNPTLGQTSPSSFSSCTMLPPMDRHKHDGPS